MKMKAVKIQLSGGLEARPVAMLVQVASQHDSTVYLESEGKKVNAKSIMGMMSLGLDSGEPRLARDRLKIISVILLISL